MNGEHGMQVPGGVMGVVMHTMVGNLPGTIAVFNRPGFNASAHFGIDQNGHIHQFGPVNGWIAWAQEDGNPHWWSVEHADNGNPDNPLTDAQLTASAQIVEVLSRHAGFPLREANTTGERGYGVHSMGGAAWGGHTCPDSPPRHVRSQQRAEILRRAQVIREPSPPPPPALTVVTNGQLGLAGLAAEHATHPATVLRATAAAAANGQYVAALATYINSVFATDTATMPDGLVLHYQLPTPGGQPQDLTWQTGQANQPADPQSLGALAVQLNVDAESILRLTAAKNPGGEFTGPEFGYVNGVFARSQVLLPAGLTLHLT